jgi:adenosyl cobinamide kinase/adenosyl cobinamide phosphate guanylyltransferase
MALVLLTGGARSGKSEAAVKLAAAAVGPVVVIATAERGDAEMTQRIELHRRERPSGWTVVEEPLRLAEAIAAVPDGACAIVDCLTVWTANALQELDASAVVESATAAAARAGARPGLTIAVTNEVGLGIVPDNALAREYRDLLGRVNAIFSQAAEQALLLVAGRALALQTLESVCGTRA